MFTSILFAIPLRKLPLIQIFYRFKIDPLPPAQGWGAGHVGVCIRPGSLPSCVSQCWSVAKYSRVSVVLPSRGCLTLYPHHTKYHSCPEEAYTRYFTYFFYTAALLPAVLKVVLVFLNLFTCSPDSFLPFLSTLCLSSPHSFIINSSTSSPLSLLPSFLHCFSFFLFNPSFPFLSLFSTSLHPNHVVSWTF